MGNDNKVIITIRYHKKTKKSRESGFNFQDQSVTISKQETSPKQIQKVISMPDLTQESLKISGHPTEKAAAEPMKDEKTTEIQSLIEKESQSIRQEFPGEKTESPIEETEKPEMILRKEEESSALQNPLPESKDLSKSKTALFLDDEITQKTEKNLYSLNEEFAKTKKTKNIFSVLVLGLFMAFLVGTTFLVTEEIKKKGTQTQLEIKDFEDINLSEAINKAKENERRLGSLQDELNNSKKNFNSQLDIIKQQSEERIKGILAQGLPEKERLKLIEEIKKKEQQEIYNAKMLHESKIREKEKQIQDIQFQLSDYQKKFEAELKAKEKLLLESGKVSEVEYNKQKESYEEKISELQRAHKKELADLKEYHSKLIEELRSEYESKIKNLQSGIEGSNIELAKKLQALQEQNIKNSADLKTKEIQNKELEKQNQDFLTELNKNNKALESFAYAINELAQNKRENGYVLDSRDFSKIIVIINNNYSVKNGDSGVIIDDEDRKVAEVELKVEKNYVLASVKGDPKGIQIRPFYRIIVNLK